MSKKILSLILIPLNKRLLVQLGTMLERLAISAIQANNIQDDFDINKASEMELLGKQAITQLDVSKRIRVAS